MRHRTACPYVYVDTSSGWTRTVRNFSQVWHEKNVDRLRLENQVQLISTDENMVLVLCTPRTISANEGKEVSA